MIQRAPMHQTARLLRDRLNFALVFFISLASSNLFAQQIPAWKTTKSLSTIEPLASVRIAFKRDTKCDKNIIELQDIADLSGSETIVKSIRNMPLGPAPVVGSRQLWTQEDVLRLLELRGVDSKVIRWGGESVCQVVRLDPTIAPHKPIEYTRSEHAPQVTAIAERIVAGVLSNYLKSKSSDASTWTIKPEVPNEYIKLLSQQKWIKGVAGGVEPWTGEQQFSLLVQTQQGEQSIELTATVRIPSMVFGATGPLAKGHIIDESDLKLVRLTTSMKATEEECCNEVEKLIGKELRRAISTGQPIQRVDVGPARIIHAQDRIDIQVLAGAMVAQTTGRAMQSGGLDEVIEVEVTGTKKRLAARVVAENLVEVISR